MKRYVEIEAPSRTENKDALYECIHGIGKILSSGEAAGVLFDLENIDFPDKLLTTVKAGIRTGYPTVRSAHIACVVKEISSVNQDFDPNIVSKSFNNKLDAIEWLTDQLDG